MSIKPRRKRRAGREKRKSDAGFSESTTPDMLLRPEPVADVLAPEPLEPEPDSVSIDVQARRRAAKGSRRNSVTPGGLDDFRRELDGDGSRDTAASRRAAKGSRRNSVTPGGLDDFRRELSGESDGADARASSRRAAKGNRRNSVTPDGLDAFRAELKVGTGEGEPSNVPATTSSENPVQKKKERRKRRPGREHTD